MECVGPAGDIWGNGSSTGLHQQTSISILHSQVVIAWTLNAALQVKMDEIEKDIFTLLNFYGVNCIQIIWVNFRKVGWTKLPFSICARTMSWRSRRRGQLNMVWVSIFSCSMVEVCTLSFIFPLFFPAVQEYWTRVRSIMRHQGASWYPWPSSLCEGTLLVRWGEVRGKVDKYCCHT